MWGITIFKCERLRAWKEDVDFSSRVSLRASHSKPTQVACATTLQNQWHALRQSKVIDLTTFCHKLTRRSTITSQCCEQTTLTTPRRCWQSSTSELSMTASWWASGTRWNVRLASRSMSALLLKAVRVTIRLYLGARMPSCLTSAPTLTSIFATVASNVRPRN